tara:strand:+ start:1107 stop:2027 length:921 start_codon:yes stop_codon:yes gene_type:complete
MSLKNKQVLVTGGSGVIGKELLKILCSEGAKVRNVDMRALPHEVRDLDVEHFQMDLSDPKSQFLFRFEPEYVFHLAADFERSVESFEFWESNFLNNVAASRELIKKTSGCKSLKKIIFASSYLVYDKELYNKDVYKISEDDRIKPRNLCGVAKLQTEMDLEFLSRHKNIDTVSARIYRVFGPGSRDIVSRWSADMLVNEDVELFGEGNCFDYIYSKDVARALCVMAKRDLKRSVYNLGTGEPTSIGKVFQTISDNITSYGGTVSKTDSVIMNEGSYADMSLFMDETGWKPEYSLSEAIKEVVEYNK